MPKIVGSLSSNIDPHRFVKGDPVHPAGLRAFSGVPPFLGYVHDWLLTKEKAKTLTWSARPIGSGGDCLSA